MGLTAQSFTDHTAASGIDHHHLDHHAIGGGVAIFDYNGDGHADLYLTGGEGPDRLYRNRGDATFEDVTKTAGLDGLRTIPTVGVLATDLNDDGYPDLFLTTGPEYANILLLNEGGERFVNRSNAAGIRHAAWSSSATAADYDRDGDVDLYVGNYVDFSAEPFERHITAPQADFLYRNEGNGTFTLLDPPGPAGCTLATLFSDYDGDGAPDLFVLNDFGDFWTPNQLLHNQTAAFANVSEQVEFRAAINCMGIAPGDFNRDGLPDYFLTNIDVNYYYQGRTDGTFDNLTHTRMAAGGRGVSWGTAFADFDNDGHLDLATARGTLLTRDDHQESLLWRGRPDGLSLEPVPDALATDGNNKARGLATGDLNNDGLPDIVVAGLRTGPAGTATARIFLNTTVNAGNYLTFTDLRDRALPVGTRFTIYAGTEKWVRAAHAGGSYLSSTDDFLHIGLGNVEYIDSIEINWPDRSDPFVIPGPLYPNQRLRLAVDGVVSTINGIPASRRISAYPNPASRLLHLRARAKMNSREAISWLDAGGKVWARTQVQWTEGKARLEMPGTLPSGNYLLHGEDWVVPVVVAGR